MGTIDERPGQAWTWTARTIADWVNQEYCTEEEASSFLAGFDPQSSLLGVSSDDLFPRSIIYVHLMRAVEAGKLKPVKKFEAEEQPIPERLKERIKGIGMPTRGREAGYMFQTTDVLWMAKDVPELGKHLFAAARGSGELYKTLVEMGLVDGPPRDDANTPQADEGAGATGQEQPQAAAAKEGDEGAKLETCRICHGTRGKYVGPSSDGPICDVCNAELLAEAAKRQAHFSLGHAANAPANIARGDDPSMISIGGNLPQQSASSSPQRVVIHVKGGASQLMPVQLPQPISLQLPQANVPAPKAEDPDDNAEATRGEPSTAVPCDVAKGPAADHGASNIFRRDGDFLRITFEGDELPPIKRLRGMVYLEELFRHPKTWISVAALNALEREPAPSDSEPACSEPVEPDEVPSVDGGSSADFVADPKAIAAVERNLEELRNRYQETADISKRQVMAEEIRKLENWLADAKGPAGELKRFSNAKRQTQRKSVAAAIDDAERAIRKHGRAGIALADHIKVYVKKGVDCFYGPPEDFAGWDF